MKLLIGIIFLFTSNGFSLDQVDTKKVPFLTNRNEEQQLKEKFKFETKSANIKKEQQPNEEKKITTRDDARDDAMEAQLLNCKSGKDERALELIKKGTGCEVIYTKQGSAKIIAQQKSGTLRCDDVFQSLHNKLIKGGFSCESQ